jgi:hypothetical protein
VLHNIHKVSNNRSKLEKAIRNFKDTQKSATPFTTPTYAERTAWERYGYDQLLEGGCAAKETVLCGVRLIKCLLMMSMALISKTVG